MSAAIPREDIACVVGDLAHESLAEHWQFHQIDEPMEIMEGNDHSESIAYSERAQRIFNRHYDEIDGEILTLIEDHPDLGIEAIEQRHRDGLT